MQVDDILRLSVLARDITTVRLDCENVCSLEYGDIVELWLKCNSVLGMLSSLRLLASTGLVLAVGGIDGSIYRFLPRSVDKLVRSATQTHHLQPGSTVIVQPCDKDVRRIIEALEHYALKMTLKRSSTRVKAVLARPLDTGLLFDRGVRLLKPVTAPPTLLKPSRHAKAPSANAHHSA